MNFNQSRTETYYQVLNDGTVVSSRWKKEPGEYHTKPGSRPAVQLPIKYCLTQAEYVQCLENQKELVQKFAIAKAIKIRDGQGWTKELKMEVLKELFNSVVTEPLMKETFFISMNHFV